MFSRIKTIHQAYHHLVSNLKKIYDEEEAVSIAGIVFEEVLGYDSIKRILNENDLLPAALFEQLDHVMHQLLQHKPVQYITGKAHFYGLIFYVNESVLIPRPETEELVDWIITTNKEHHFKNILDIGTGSGCIPITLKKNIPDAEVYAIDVSEDALAVAKRNAIANSTDITFIQADILTVGSNELGVGSFKSRVTPNSKLQTPNFEVIVSNPPYVLHSESKQMNQNVLDYEPHLALFVNDDNALIFYDKISDFALSYLNKGGYLFFEINETKGEEIVKLLQDKGFTAIELRQDLRGKDRMIKARVL